MIDERLLGRTFTIENHFDGWVDTWAQELSPDGKVKPDGDCGRGIRRWALGEEVTLHKCPSDRACRGEYELRSANGKYSTGGINQSNIMAILGSSLRDAIIPDSDDNSPSFVGKELVIASIPSWIDPEEYYDVDEDEWYHCGEDFKWEVGIKVLVQHFENNSYNTEFELVSLNGKYASKEMDEDDIHRIFKLGDYAEKQPAKSSTPRKFRYGGNTYEVDDDNLSVDEVREKMCELYPELSRATVSYGADGAYVFTVPASRDKSGRFVAADTSGSISKYSCDTSKINEKDGDSTMSAIRGANGFIKNFGAVTDGSIAMTIGGQIAVRNGEEYFRWNDETKSVESQLDLVIKDMSEFIYIFPVTEVAVGDIIKHKDSYLQILEVLAEGGLKTVNVKSGTHCTVAKETSIIGISFYYKVVCLFQQISSAKDGGMNPMLLMLMDKGGNGKDSLLPLLMMGGMGGAAMDPMMMMLLMDKSGGFELKDMLMMQMMMPQTKGKKAAGGADFNPMMLMLMGDGKMDAKTLMLMSMMNAKK